ncbi:CAP domain-containing protein [Deinococcus planocerae]|uniref:CAP domain-containing protein n=1 Tax=Deinococcus planocerae TaxID=1737569 RepID=UPI000C7F601E|nr:CAP domain-containing protein [Deinococcus planocerae]
MRTLPILLLLGSLSLTACGGTGTTGTPRATDAGDQTKSTAEALILGQVNEARAQSRLCGDQRFEATTPVTWNGYLAKAARAHAADMATRGFFDHVNPDGKDVQERTEAAGYTGWQVVGENLAAGYDGEHVVAAWLASPSHCKTLMDPRFKELGVGYVNDPASPKGTYWVEDFGTR